MSYPRRQASLLGKTLAIAILSLIPKGSAAGAPGTLGNLLLTRSNDTVQEEQYHTIHFTTATAGAIDSIEIDYQSATGIPDIGASKVIEASGVQSGTWSAGIPPTHAVYAVTAPVNIAAGTPIRIMVGPIRGRTKPGCYFLVVTTKVGVTPLDSGQLLPDTICDKSGMAFGTCLVTLPLPVQGRERTLHQRECTVAASMTDVIATPRVGEQFRVFIPMGSSLHCEGQPQVCHVDVRVRRDQGAVGSGHRQRWSYMAFQSP
jgi:hypothetical protein